MTNEEYLELAEKQTAGEPPLEWKAPSGATWLYTAFSIAQYSIEGRLPTALFSKIAETDEQPTEAEMIKAGMQTLEIVRFGYR